MGRIRRDNYFIKEPFFEKTPKNRYSMFLKFLFTPKKLLRAFFKNWFSLKLIVSSTSTNSSNKIKVKKCIGWGGGRREVMNIFFSWNVLRKGRQLIFVKHFWKNSQKVFLRGLKVSKLSNPILGFLFIKYLSPLPLPVPRKKSKWKNV